MFALRRTSKHNSHLFIILRLVSIITAGRAGIESHCWVAVWPGATTQCNPALGDCGVGHAVGWCAMCVWRWNRHLCVCAQMHVGMRLHVCVGSCTCLRMWCAYMCMWACPYMCMKMGMYARACMHACLVLHVHVRMHAACIRMLTSAVKCTHHIPYKHTFA